MNNKDAADGHGRTKGEILLEMRDVRIDGFADERWHEIIKGIDDFVEVARLRGEGIGWVMRREILPNILPPLIAEFGLRFCFVFLGIAALSFLGVGIRRSQA